MALISALISAPLRQIFIMAYTVFVVQLNMCIVTPAGVLVTSDLATSASHTRYSCLKNSYDVAWICDLSGLGMLI